MSATFVLPNEKKVMTPEFIIDTVADRFDITHPDCRSGEEQRNLFARWQCILCHEIFECPAEPESENNQQQRDHTTVMHIGKNEKEMSAKDECPQHGDILKENPNHFEIGGAFVTL